MPTWQTSSNPSVSPKTTECEPEQPREGMRHLRDKLEPNLQMHLSHLCQRFLDEVDEEVAALCNELHTGTTFVSGEPASLESEELGEQLGELAVEVPVALPWLAVKAGAGYPLCIRDAPAGSGDQSCNPASKAAANSKPNDEHEVAKANLEPNGEHSGSEANSKPNDEHEVAKANLEPNGEHSGSEAHLEELNGDRNASKATAQSRISSLSDDIFMPSMSTKSQLGPTTCRKERLRRLISHWRYESFSSMLILLNCATMGIQAHGQVTDDLGQGVLIFCAMAEHVFTALFALECCLRWYAFGKKGFSPKREAGRENLTDAVLVFFTGILIVWIIPLISFIAGVEDASDYMNTFLLLRVARLARLLRVFQRFPLFREAWMLIRGLMDSSRTLVWTVVVIFFVTYVFAVVGLVTLVPRLQNAIVALSDPEARRSLAEVVDIVNGLDRLMFTLVQVLMGDSYHGFMREVLMYIPGSWVYFYSYSAIGGIVLLNLVTAIIVENARENSENDHEHAIREKEAEKRRTFKKLRHLFKTMDADGSNSISWSEFKSSFENEGMLQYWTLLNFKPEDCNEVFGLIDDGDGVIEINEFIHALSRMQGYAQAKDVYRLQRSLQMMQCSIDQLAGTDIARRLSFAQNDTAKWSNGTDLQNR